MGRTSLREARANRSSLNHQQRTSRSDPRLLRRPSCSGYRHWGDVCHWLVMCNVCREMAVQRLVRLPAAVAAVRVPSCRVGALIGRPCARPSAVGATRRPLAGVSSVIGWGGGRQSLVKPSAEFSHGC